MDVSIIMINYNTYDYTVNAIDSIIKHTKDLNYEIILIDNLSPDDSGELLHKKYQDDIIYVQSGDNLGTSKAFNLGLNYVSGKYVLWLNTDIIIKDNFIFKLYDYMEHNSNCGICGGNLLDFNGKPTHSYQMYLPTLKLHKKYHNIMQTFINDYVKKSYKNEYNFTNVPIEVGYITGADMMIRSCIFDYIGNFNEKIFMYFEESEFTFRMKKETNYKVMNVPTATMYHLEGGSFKKKSNSSFKYKINCDSAVIYYESCYNKETAIKFLKYELKKHKKMKLLATLLFRKNIKNNCIERLKILKDKLNEYESE